MSCSVRIMKKMGERLKRVPSQRSAYRWGGGITSTALVAFFCRCRRNFCFAFPSPDDQSKRGEGDHRYGGRSCSRTTTVHVRGVDRRRTNKSHVVELAGWRWRGEEKKRYHRQILFLSFCKSISIYLTHYPNRNQYILCT